MEPFIYSIAASFLVSLVSFVGVIVLFEKRLLRSPLITVLISFAAGALLGDAFIHLLSQNIESFGFSENTYFPIFAGVIVMLIIEAYFHCSHDSSHDLEEHKKTILAKMNIAGDSVHNLLDGVAIGASFLINPAAGVASTIAVIMHEIPQELADVAVLIYSGWSKKKILVLNFLTALTSIVGVLLVYFISTFTSNSEKYMVPFAAGQFIYIALSDLLPEIHKKRNVSKYILEISTFIFGIIVMYLLTYAE